MLWREHTYSHRDSDTNLHSNCNVYSHRYRYGDCHGHSDCNIYPHGYSNCHAYSHCHSNGNSDCASTYSHAYSHSNTIALFALNRLFAYRDCHNRRY